MLIRVFGEGPQVKLINFLVTHAGSEFSKTELAMGANITRPTLYKLLDNLLQEKLVIETRKVGNIQLYQVNAESPVIEKVSSLQGLLVNIELEKKEYLASKSKKKQNLDYFY